MEYLFMGIVALVGVGLGYFLANRAAAAQQQRLSEERDDLREELTRMKTELGEAREAATAANHSAISAREQLQAAKAALENARQERRKEVETITKSYVSQIRELRSDHEIALKQAHEKIDDLQNRLEHTQQALKEQETLNQSLEEKQNEKALELEQLNERFREAFENTANEIQEKSVSKLNKEAKEKFEAILAPFKQQLEQFQKQYQEGTKTFHGLEKHIQLLQDESRKLGEEASNLTKALKGDKQVQGRFGEEILERLLEFAGFKKDIDFYTQSSTTTDAGNRLRPDVIVSLPDSRNIVIDSKVTLVSYAEYHAAEDEQAKTAALKAMNTAIRKHISTLGEKAYHAHFDNTPGMTVMFFFNESAYQTAIAQDPDLLDFAYQQKVVLTSPTNLLVLLWLIKQEWRNAMAVKNATDIVEQGERVIEYIGKIYSAFEDTEKHLEKALQSTTNGKKWLSDSKRSDSRLDGIIQKLQELGCDLPSGRNELPSDLNPNQLN